MAATAVTAGLNNSFVSASDTYGFSSEHISQMHAATGMAGSLTKMGVEYAMTGQTTMNILNFADITGMMGMGSGIRGGFLELHLGEDGANLALCSSGTDVGFTSMSNVFSGIGNIYNNGRMQSYANSMGEEDLAIAMRSMYSFGDGGGHGLLNGLLNGTDQLVLGGAPEGAQALTVAGRDGKTIYMNTGGDTPESWLHAGITLQHEAYRDGRTGTAPRRTQKPLLL